MTPLISIIVESYNEEQNGLAPPSETMEALLRQDFPLERVELILGGSAAQIRIWETMQDNWKSFGAVRFMTVDQANSHYWQLKNQGAAFASGEFLAFIDCDGLPGPHWLPSLYRALQEGADVSVGPSLFRTARFGPNSPVMLAAALPAWSFNLSTASDHGKPQAAALMGHNLGIRRELLLRHPFRQLARSFASSLLFFELRRAGAKFSYQPEQRVAHGVHLWWWIARFHFRRGWETYEGRASDASWPRIRALEKLKIIEPVALRMGLVCRDISHWLRFSKVLGVGGASSVLMFPLVAFASSIARTSEMVGMYAWLFARRATEHQARF
jgi:cellulose synthase/poly-beta-1,6-N-acetylglucosamine synthase-like glycosyltransferase